MNEFKLDNEPRIETGFKTPEYYFDDFSTRVIQQLPENKPKVISIFVKNKIWIFTVAAVLLLALFIPIINTLQTQPTTVDKITLENYLTYHAAITDDDLVDLLDEEDIQKMKIDYKIEDKAIEDLLSTNSNLEEYIID